MSVIHQPDDEFIRAILSTRKVLSRGVLLLGDAPYLERIALEQGVYLHVIYASDADRDPHDHPFDFESTIIYGRYVEHTPIVAPKCAECGATTSYHLDPKCRGTFTHGIIGWKSSTFKPGDVNKKSAADLHRLELVDGPVVTLVRRGPIIRNWGFLTRDGWVSHDTYAS